ncbi:protein artichoke-like [Lytechinus pictus]|uniref:protein artichoke-like n=1 Tax=Lytechinus pictus TaxID=7653 RepID=UPI0030B9C258
MARILVRFAAFIAGLYFIPLGASTVSTLDSCPDHCYCFVVSRNAPPPTALLSSYIQVNDWEDGSKAIACWGRKDIPQPISPDIKYLILIGSQKPKRRRQKDLRVGLRPHIRRGSLTLRRPRTYIIPDPTPVRRRNIRTVPRDALNGLREIIQIDLHGNKITELSPATFHGLSNLAALNLNDNRIKSLHTDLLHDALALRTFLVSGNSLRSLPETIFRNNHQIERLDLSDNILWGVPEDCFQPLGELTSLNISYNRLNEKNPMIFTGLSQLKELFLQWNKFTRIDPTLFLSNTHITKVDLSFNRIKTIAPNAFQNQRYLKILDLSGNSLTSLSSLSFRGATALKELDLSFNAVDAMMDGLFTDLANLTRLYLKNNRLPNITAETFGNIPSLSYLTLTDNNISQISPNALAGLVALEFLDLSGNSLSHLQSGAFQGLVALMELNLADNKLYIIEPEALKTTPFSFMSQLTWLNLQGNRLLELQRGVFRGAPSLRVLTLSRNRISRIVPDAFGGFNRLHRLMMSDNTLERLPDGVFRLLGTLETLNLQNNSLTEISDKAFQGLSALSNLNLAENKLTNGKMKWLKHIQSVQTLNLIGNRFGEISSGDFEVAGNLRYLYLSNNNLTKVSVRNDSRLYLFNLTLSHNNLTNLQDFSAHVLPGRVLDLAGNPWNCNCRLIQYLTDLTRRSRIRFDNEYQIRCNSPDHLQGVKTMDLVRSKVSCIGDELVNLPVITEITTPKPASILTPSPPNYMELDRLRWSWVVLIWDSATDTPICNGALISPSFVLTSYQCLTRITKIKSYLRLVSGCPQPLGGNCQDKVWTAPSNLEIKVSAGQGTLTKFLLVAETYRVLRMHRVLPDAAPQESAAVLLEISPSVDLAGPASTINILGQSPAFGQLIGKRVLASGWWTDHSKTPEVVGRQKRRHYQLTSLQCGSSNEVHQPYLCGHLEQHLEDYKDWDSLGTPVTIRERNQWKLVGILVKNEGAVGFIKDVRQEGDKIHQIIAGNPRSERMSHPY